MRTVASRRMRGNSLRIKITLERESGARSSYFDEGGLFASPGFAVPLISLAPLAAFFLLVPTVNKANCPNWAVESTKF